jgi:hypothetical protein
VPVRERKLGDEGRDGEREGGRGRMLMKSNGDCVQRTIKAWLLFMKLVSRYYIVVNLKNILRLIKSVWKT